MEQSDCWVDRCIAILTQHFNRVVTGSGKYGRFDNPLVDIVSDHLPGVLTGPFLKIYNYDSRIQQAGPGLK